MSDNEMLYCLIAFILGWLVSRQIRNGFIVELFDVGGQRRRGPDSLIHVHKRSLSSLRWGTDTHESNHGH